MIKSIGVDDYVMIFSMVCFFKRCVRRTTMLIPAKVCSIIYNGLCIGQSRYGLGLPVALRPAMSLNKYSEVSFNHSEPIPPG